MRPHKKQRRSASVTPAIAEHKRAATRKEESAGGRTSRQHYEEQGREGHRHGDAAAHVSGTEPTASAHLYGLLPVLEALRAGRRPLERIIIAEGAHRSRLREVLELARHARVPVRRVPRDEIERLAARANHQGIVATIAAAQYRDTDELLDALAARVGTDDPPLALALDGIEDPRNLGAIIRTAECAGAHAVFVPERRAAGLTETVAKTAAGALEYVQIARAPNFVRLIEELKERGIWTVGSSVDAGLDYTAWDWTVPCALFFGGEGEGLRRLVRERCDTLVRIPLRGRIASLNVSVAAGIVLYEAVRQRTLARAASYITATDNRRPVAGFPSLGDQPMTGMLTAETERK